MQKTNLILNENELTYQSILEMREHARKYSQASDKKEFLKNISAYEQKLILLDSERPFEVLCYLSELDLETSKLILNELNYDDITKILERFTSEDKQNFYKNFSHLSLVNRFIMYDKNSEEHIDDLTLDRKVELLDSTDSKTISASAKVYDSIPEEQRAIVEDKIKTTNAISVINDSESIKSETVEDLEPIKEFQENNILEEKIEENEKIENKEKIENDLKLTELNEFLKLRFQHYKNNVPGFKDLNIDDPNLYSSLPTELKLVVNNDFETLRNEKKLEEIKEQQKQILLDEKDNNKDELKSVEEKSQSELLDKFNDVKGACEAQEIEQIKNNLNSVITDEATKVR